MESPDQEAPIERSITIVIDSIENIVMKDKADISFVVIHNNVILEESIPITIEPSFEESPQIYNVDLAVNFSFTINDRKSMDSVVSTPVLIKVMCEIETQHSPNSAGSNMDSRKKSKFTAQKQMSISSNIIGFCSLDLMPILLGEQSFTERLIVETPDLSFNANAISWQNLPVLTTTVIHDGEEIFPSGMEINFLNITVESIYNPPAFFAEDEEYKAGTIIYIDNKVPENIIFDNGKWTNYRDVERTKRWQSLSQLQSRARLSKYKLSCDYRDIRIISKLTANLDLEKKSWQDEPRIEWNFMSRSMIYDVGAQIMQNHIIKHKYWPFQFVVVEKNTGKHNIKSKEEKPIKHQLYQCYVDLSELLYPGKKSTRVVAQLYTYNSSNMAEKTSLEKDIFNINTLNRDLKEPERKNNASKSIQSDVEISTPSIPLTSEIGEPVFVIIEIELQYPLVPCKLESDLSDIIDETTMPKLPKPFYVYSGEMAEEQYATCIRKLVQIITESYRDFHDEKKLLASKKQENEKAEEVKYCFVPKEDELTCFTQYLYKTGTYMAMRSTLKAKVITLLDQKFKTEVNTIDSLDSQNFVASVYTYLVEQMHLAINKIIESRLMDDSPKITFTERLYFYAEEAYELGYMDDARRHYRAAIAADKDDPEAWTEYAIFHLKIGDVERAKECCHEAILSDRRYKIALLMYGLILAEDRNYREAEVFLKIVTDLYPRFVEGWVILHLFYIRTDYCPGIDLTLRIAEKCMADEDRETEMSNEDPLAWTTIHCPRDSLYMITATFLMKLHLCDFAGMALAEEMSRVGRSIHVLYYLAVLHYLSHRYKHALSHLEEAECTYGMDYSVSSLMGHCHFQEGNFKEAVRCYEFASMVFNRPDDLHLVQTRMGLYHEDAGDYERALKVFLGASKVSPTAETWLGAGIAFYELQRFTEAEAALTEANQIDNRNANVWKYLCFLNMSLRRYDEFDQCYRQFVQINRVSSLEKRSLKPRKNEPGSVML